jgi:hypothetical protein
MAASLVAVSFVYLDRPGGLSVVSRRSDTLARLYCIDSRQLGRTESEAERPGRLEFKDCGIVGFQEPPYFGRGRVGLL